MLASMKGMVLTIASVFKKPVTDQYPNEPRKLQDRYMGFPALTWDFDVEEPYCTSCMVCIRQCPTQCMSATMKDNPLQKEGKSKRRKIVDTFEINLNRCILCGICVNVCNFDAIVMSHEHEMSVYERNGDRVDLIELLEMGKRYQEEQNWVPPSTLRKKAAPRRRPAARRPAARKPRPTPKAAQEEKAKPEA